MPRFSRLIITMLWGLSAASLSFGAQSSDENEDSPKTNRRGISKNVAAALADRMPKYNPPKSEPETKEPEPSEMQDMRDVDKPRNKIIRLPKFIVRQKRAPVFRDRDIYTEKGLGELAKNRYFSETSFALSSFKIPFFEKLAESYALMLYQQDERLKNISDLTETADDIDWIDPDSSEEILKATRETYYNREFDQHYRRH